jgi:ribosome biogenesis protein Tsr3
MAAAFFAFTVRAQAVDSIILRVMAGPIACQADRTRTAAKAMGKVAHVDCNWKNDNLFYSYLRSRVQAERE